MPVQVGSILEGRVIGITNFGAFVELPGGVTGLVHISEIAEVYVKNVSDFLKYDDWVRVKVIAVDQRGKISLSIKQASETFQRRQEQGKWGLSFEEKLARFFKESEERQRSIRRNIENRRGSRGRRVGREEKMTEYR